MIWSAMDLRGAGTFIASAIDWPAHRLFLNLNDPEVTWAMPPHLNSATDTATES